MLKELEALDILDVPTKNTLMKRGSQRQIVPTDLTKEQANIDEELRQLTTA